MVLYLCKEKENTSMETYYYDAKDISFNYHGAQFRVSLTGKVDYDIDGDPYELHDFEGSLIYDLSVVNSSSSSDSDSKRVWLNEEVKELLEDDAFVDALANAIWENWDTNVKVTGRCE
ncbi:MAG: hypothetical protein HUK20_08780 [Fibrobacter sp.]|nr:hypothetical protein [Fibrobacter sp.]